MIVCYYNLQLCTICYVYDYWQTCIITNFIIIVIITSSEKEEVKKINIIITMMIVVKTKLNYNSCQNI